MRKDVFWKLSSHLRDARLLRDTIHVTVEEQLAMLLHTVGHNLRNCVIGFSLKILPYVWAKNILSVGCTSIYLVMILQGTTKLLCELQGF